MRQLLQNETKNSYCKVFKKCGRSLLQSALGITKCGRPLLQITSGTTKYDRNTSVITSCDNYYKVRRSNIVYPFSTLFYPF